MLVHLQNPWYASSFPQKHDGGRVFSGQYFKAGKHDMPAWFEEHLPKTATILEKDKQYEAPDIDMDNTLRSYDMARSEAEAEAEVLTVAEETRTGKSRTVRK